MFSYDWPQHGVAQMFGSLTIQLKDLIVAYAYKNSNVGMDQYLN